MDEFEKVEKLRQRAGVSYEEAVDALRACNGDLLDAMVYLEKLGKVKSPEQSTYSTGSNDFQYVSVRETVEQNERNRNGETFWSKFKHLCSVLWRKGNDNFLCVKHSDELLFKVPVWVFVVALLFAWELVLVAMVISLFFDCRYSFVGKGNLETVNNVMNQAEDFVNNVKKDFNDK